MKRRSSDFEFQAVEAGAWLGQQLLNSSSSTSLLTSVNPSTEESLAQVRTADSSIYDKLIHALHNEAQTWRNVPAPKRGELVYQLGQKIRQHQRALAELITLEMGKPAREAEGEVQEMIDMADFAVGQSRMLYGKTMHSERALHRLYEQWHPYGVVGVITAFNFPMAVWAWNAMIALIAGNVVLWKPSSQTPLCALAIQRLCAEVLQEGRYPDVLGLWFPEHHATAELMINDPRVALLSFTGSTAVGRHMAERVAHRLGRSLLELGGNNAVIIDESADLSLALHAVVFGALGTSGQRCTSTRRVFIHARHEQVFLKALKKAFSDIKIGLPWQHDVHMGPLINAAAVGRYHHVLHELSSLADLWVGPQSLPSRGYFVAPVLVVNLDFSNPMVQQETFAPIVYVHIYEDFHEAVKLNNQVPQGLSSSLFTQKLQHAEYFLSASGSDCGIANINVGTSGAEIGGAFGGEKETGGGREAGSDAWKSYMRRQTNTINWGTSLPLAQGIKFEL
jgi:aldehyde dehydrogenase (NAD+)